MRLASNQMQPHRLGFQSEAWIVDEQSTVQGEAGRPQVAQRERVVSGHWCGDAARPACRHGIVEILRCERHRGGTLTKKVEESEVEANLTISTYQAWLPLKARVRPVLCV